MSTGKRSDYLNVVLQYEMLWRSVFHVFKIVQMVPNRTTKRECSIYFTPILHFFTAFFTKRFLKLLGGKEVEYWREICYDVVLFLGLSIMNIIIIELYRTISHLTHFWPMFPFYTS